MTKLICYIDQYVLAWSFWYIVEDLLRQAIWILEAKLEYWHDSGVNSEEDMPPTFIGTDLEKTGKITKDKSVNEEKTTESKVDIFEEAQTYITCKLHQK